jgi:hypothetical protein
LFLSQLVKETAIVFCGRSGATYGKNTQAPPESELVAKNGALIADFCPFLNKIALRLPSH